MWSGEFVSHTGARYVFWANMTPEKKNKRTIEFSRVLSDTGMDVTRSWSTLRWDVSPVIYIDVRDGAQVILDWSPRKGLTKTACLGTLRMMTLEA